MSCSLLLHFQRVFSTLCTKAKGVLAMDSLMAHRQGNSLSMLQEHFLVVRFFLSGEGSAHQPHKDFLVHRQQLTPQMFASALWMYPTPIAVYHLYQRVRHDDSAHPQHKRSLLHRS